MKIAIVTGVWQRPEIFEFFAEGVKRLVQAYPEIEFQTFVAGSEGQTSEQMVRNHGFNYVEVPNEPLSKKMNASVLEAKKWQPDYVLCLGSDDIVSPAAFRHYLDRINDPRPVDIIGTTDFYFYDTFSGKAAYWDGYIDQRKGDLVGAGILLSERLLNMWGWRPWDFHDRHVLDNSIKNKSKRTVPCVVYKFSLKEVGAISVDIKSGTNMTPFELWPNTTEIDPQIITNYFLNIFPPRPSAPYLLDNIVLTDAKTDEVSVEETSSSDSDESNQ